jgi:hypothetical protein
VIAFLRVWIRTESGPQAWKSPPVASCALALAHRTRIEYAVRVPSKEIAMAMFPLRAFGLLLLTTTLSVASCQAMFHAAGVDAPPYALEQLRD